MRQRQIDIHGHRGFRGHFPENTLTAFIEAVKCGADTLEMDVVISKDKQVVVSHESWMNDVFCTRPDGIPVEADSKEKYNLYKMDYSEIKKYDCGIRTNPDFPLQASLPAYKPLLSEVIEKINEYSKPRKNSITSNTERTEGKRRKKLLKAAVPETDWDVRFNIEIKTEPGADGIFNPDPETFVHLVYEEVKKNNLLQHVILQSFDVRILQEIKRKDPSVTISLLVENADGLQANLDRLGFYPEIYGPEFIHVDTELVKNLEIKNIRLIPWTVNEPSEIKKMIRLNVDGIISDYPDRVLHELVLSTLHPENY